MADLKIVELHPDSVAMLDIPAALRKLADKIEHGDYGDAHNLAWIIDEGFGVVSIGLMGRSAEPSAEAHLLFALGQRKIEDM